MSARPRFSRRLVTVMTAPATLTAVDLLARAGVEAVAGRADDLEDRLDATDASVAEHEERLEDLEARLARAEEAW